MARGTRWGMLGTAHIAEAAFLPALRAAGGRADAIAGRDAGRTDEYARRNGIERAIVGYQALLDDSEIEAVYIPLPNSLHGEWTIKALQAGKAVLCEKPLCGDVTEAQRVLEVARTAEKPLWEAFVFPFVKQQFRLKELVGGGAIGALREIQSDFYFHLRNRANIRMVPELAGGALNDVGCYPIRFSQLMVSGPPASAIALARWAAEGVDEEMQGVLEYRSGQRLVLSCGMTRDSGTFTRLIGEDGEIRISNPFHPRSADTIEIRTKDGIVTESIGEDEPTFTNAIRHIQEVIAGSETPRHTAVDDSLATEVALDLLHLSARSGKLEHAG